MKNGWESRRNEWLSLRFDHRIEQSVTSLPILRYIRRFYHTHRYARMWGNRQNLDINGNRHNPPNERIILTQKTASQRADSDKNERKRRDDKSVTVSLEISSFCSRRCEKNLSSLKVERREVSQHSGLHRCVKVGDFLLWLKQTKAETCVFLSSNCNTELMLKPSHRRQLLVLKYDGVTWFFEPIARFTWLYRQKTSKKSTAWNY